jgi:hypothetical protein
MWLYIFYPSSLSSLGDESVIGWAIRRHILSLVLTIAVGCEDLMKNVSKHNKFFGD